MPAPFPGPAFVALPIAAPDLVPSSVLSTAPPAPLVPALSACPATDCAANCMQPALSNWNASNVLFRPGMARTVGSIGDCAQAVSNRSEAPPQRANLLNGLLLFVVFRFTKQPDISPPNHVPLG